MKFKEINRLPEFEKDFKKLLKRYRTLEDDLENFIKAQLYPYHKLEKDIGSIFHIPNLRIEHPKIFKAKKFTCRSLHGKGAYSGIRIIYAYCEIEDRIDFIEIYYKGDKENEDKARIKKIYYKK